LEFKVRVYQAEDAPSVLELERTWLSEYDPEGLSRRLNWLLQNPFGCHAWIAEIGGQAVGFMAWLMVPMAIMKRTTIASVGVDLIVAPEFRRKRIAAELITASRTSLIGNGASLGLGFTSQASGRLTKKLGGTQIAPLARYYLPVTVRAFILRTFLRGGSSLSEMRRRSERLNSQFSTDLSLEPCEPTQRNLELVAGGHGLGNVRVNRDPNYLIWLFRGQQALSPRILLAKEGDEVVGYVAYSVRNRTQLLRVGELLDVAAGKSSTAQRILNALCLRSSGVDYWSANTLQGSVLAEMLKTMGFSSWSDRGSLICRTWKDDVDNTVLMNPINWHLTQFDIF